eukprot:TRINITY_DN9825_c0_g1_i1.p1 TRINITY_DN9825_c0_g1~~TRINITY_DN9825_c0_g1_i1.p1  ORF type:complete len:462 (-),score=92.87 TRINITY_DN9825_c0_g1_i1:80-1420(-)
MKLITRDLTIHFIAIRTTKKSKSEDDLKKTLELLAKVSMRYSDPVSRKPKTDESSVCSSCSVSFGWWLYVKEERIICQLCNHSFCNKCAPGTLSLKTIFSSDTENKRVKVCLACQGLVEAYYRRLDFQEKKREAESSAVVNFHRDSRNMQAHILQLLARYAEIVSTITIADYLSPDPNLISAQTEWNPLKSFSVKSIGGWFSPTTTAKSKSYLNHSQLSNSPVPTSDDKGKEKPNSSEMDSIQLYQIASQVEQEISTTLQTFSSFIKEVPESVQSKSLREKEILNHIRNGCASCIIDYHNSLKNLHRRITQMELVIIEHVYLTLKRLTFELKNVSFIGCIMPAITECLEIVKNDVKGKAKSVDQDLEWDAYEHELISRLEEELRKQPLLLNLPANAQLYRVVIPRILQILSSLQDYVRSSIAGEYFPNTLQSVDALAAELQKTIMR